MEDDKAKNFAYGLAITLGTITLGLISYIFFTSNNVIIKEPSRCEYSGWAYADKEIFDSSDGCNICFCHSGETICSKNDCIENTSEQDDITNE